MTLGDSQSEVFCAKFDPEDKYLACGFGDGAIRIYNMISGKLAFTLCGNVSSTGMMQDDMPVCGLRWRPQNESMKTSNVLVSIQADGSIKHWHATSGKCLHNRVDDPENHLYALDYNSMGTKLATAGRDCKVRVYDEATKSLDFTFEGKADQPGHSNRIFALKFNPLDSNQIVSGGWDNTIQIYDIRKKSPVESLYGPHLCGDAIDFKSDGVTILTGSYRQDDCLELWDLRMFKKTRIIDWNGPKKLEIEADPETGEKPTIPVEAPFLYSAMFSTYQDMIIAGGAGRNEVRVFDYESGEIVCIVN